MAVLYGVQHLAMYRALASMQLPWFRVGITGAAGFVVLVLVEPRHMIFDANSCPVK